MSSELTSLGDGANGSTYSGGEAPPEDGHPLLEPTASPASGSVEELEEKYAPYVRIDAYGDMGRGELPFSEKLLLGIALATLVPIRVAVGVMILILYYLICRICTLFSEPNLEDGQEDYAHMVEWRRRVVVRCGRFLSRVMLFLFGFYWIHDYYRILNTEDGYAKQFVDSERPGAIVSNHVSYLDILYHMSSSFPSFVAKRPVARLPLVGLISKCLGCVYVRRESRGSDFKGVSGLVTERIQEAHQNKLCPMMMLFPAPFHFGVYTTKYDTISILHLPQNCGQTVACGHDVESLKQSAHIEGTTTNGDYLLPFKTGAFLAKAPVLPVILRYPYKRFSPAWDSISGVRHVSLLLCQFVNHIEVIHLPVYYPSDQEKEDPKLYASNVRKFMATEGKMILSDIGLAEKRFYHAVLNGNSLPCLLHEKDD
ncbi:lysophospholipid acyltransferase LPEAT1-like isoform X1 [Typha latifolia]|uniref:lysophospholipid acyltransferase LPEAT1-like isoform X1 n=1 Tax=Typha latifolia TaxID=4733 RepID=UPI003C304185